jgi:hypothetical protein
MTRRKRSLCIAAAVCLSALSGGCGTTGSRPTLYPEVKFRVQTEGGSTFTVDEFVVGLPSNPAVAVQHTFPPGTTFTQTSDFSFYFENAAPPYTGSFSLVSGGNIGVTLTVSDKSYEPVWTSGVGTTAVVTSSQQPMPTPIAPTQEVRFDVCVPLLTPGTCFITQGDSGLFGKTFTGTVGDASQTHELNGSTPSIYFLEDAQESADGVFTLDQTGSVLVAQLFINGTLRQTQTGAGTKNVIIRQDL